MVYIYKMLFKFLENTHPMTWILGYEDDSKNRKFCKAHDERAFSHRMIEAVIAVFQSSDEQR
jgi:hypothetical protein